LVGTNCRVASSSDFAFNKISALSTDFLGFQSPTANIILKAIVVVPDLASNYLYGLADGVSAVVTYVWDVTNIEIYTGGAATANT
jgi:hypothetical protein